MYDVRDRDWSTCPHCNVKFTRKQITNKSFNAFREKCDACQQLIYVNPKENQRKATFFLIPLMPMSLHQLFDLHFILLVLLAILFIISLSYFYVPYMIRFSDKDTSMDDWKK